MQDRADAVLSLRRLSKIYHRTRDTRGVVALAGVDLDVPRHATLAIVGRSGSGKSTLARILAGLERPSSGSVAYVPSPGTIDATMAEGGGSPMELLRRKVQLLFQETDWALDPRFTAAESIEEPLVFRTALRRDERRHAALSLMDRVGLPKTWADRRPFEFSGGQRKRIAIARSLAVAPEVLVLDEPFTGLDLSTRAQIVNLLLTVREERGLTLVFIVHDMAVAEALADRLAVLHQGTAVDSCLPEELRGCGRHPQTEALLRACQPPEDR